MSRTTTDDQLARQAAAGDRDAFAAIFDRHHQALYRYCLSVTRNPDDARDALQSTFEKALRAMPSQRVEGGLRAWLFSIARNESLSVIAKRDAAVPAGDAPWLDEQTSPDAATEAASRERLRQLSHDLGQLPERQREALVMREMGGLEYAEIGVALAMSAPAARQAVYEGRTALLDLSAGRDMDCAAIQRRLSDDDRRAARGRRLKAHLSDCAVCTAFAGAMQRRKSDFGLLFPALPAVAAAGILQGALGGGAVLGGVAAGGSGAGSAAGAAPRMGASSGARLAIGGAAVVAVSAATFGIVNADNQSEPSAVSTPAPIVQQAKPARSATQVPPPPEAAAPAGTDSSSVSAYSGLPDGVTGTLDDGTASGGDAGSDGSGSGAGAAALPFTG
jgi:RNA polymerase sigma factor (sigma-70 family)